MERGKRIERGKEMGIGKEDAREKGKEAIQGSAERKEAGTFAVSSEELGRKAMEALTTGVPGARYKRWIARRIDEEKGKKYAAEGTLLERDKEIGKAMVDARRHGLPLRMCAAMAGISERTLRTWMDKGEEDMMIGLDSPFARLSRAMRMANGAYVMERMEKINEASDAGNWQASAWLLERTEPQDYSQATRVEAKVGAQADVTIVADVPQRTEVPVVEVRKAGDAAEDGESSSAQALGQGAAGEIGRGK